MSLKGLDIYCEMENKDLLVDFLLAKGYDDFYFFPCSRYGAGAFLISAEEQVSARREFGLFRLFIREEEMLTLSSALKNELKGKTLKIFTYGVSEI